ncbi:hypothetical protein AAFF_G00232430 [Aldrovandia affinis]|uniref:Secreted protein n=1 Tax=Aldrovandia affinis TaxID=143900 RepID=A0AAD7R245_9TELE|nr:hypothetical protein AAFF_G00232430 [Aldrovandia affinis]
MCECVVCVSVWCVCVCVVCVCVCVCVCAHPVLALEQAAVLQVVLDDDVGHGVEDELHVLGVGGAGEVCVDLLCVLLLVQVLKLGLDVAGRLVVLIGS